MQAGEQTKLVSVADSNQEVFNKVNMFILRESLGLFFPQAI